ncbi:hypothetical protein C8R42DRAFT_685167 [Lentinula raphanica]|nr:hypothetical protein C8R42DRAFT_685167 [Lentinula raphanica]
MHHVIPSTLLRLVSVIAGLSTSFLMTIHPWHLVLCQLIFCNPHFNVSGSSTCWVASSGFPLRRSTFPNLVQVLHTYLRPWFAPFNDRQLKTSQGDSLPVDVSYYLFIFYLSFIQPGQCVPLRWPVLPSF